jgi:nucleoside-diphosphate-sugar epimerase
MKVVITGGAGFIGRRLAESLLARGTLTGPSGTQEAIDELLLFDVTEGPALDDIRVTQLAGDIAQKSTVARLIDRRDTSVFHLASVVSGGGEQDFDLALSVNIRGGIHVLDACRALVSNPRLVFASSVAVFGGPAMPAAVGDTTKQTPQTTYGMTKAVLELIINDYTRKGFLEGRSARLPTVIIRPGKPNKAASSFASGLFREPLNGVDCDVPVTAATVMPVLGYRTVVENLIRLHEIDGARLGPDRAVSLPSLDVSVEEMIESLHRVAGNRLLGAVRIVPDPLIEAIVATWPQRTFSDRGREIGLVCDSDLDAIIRAYIEDYLPR